MALIALHALCVVLVLVDIAARTWRIGVVFDAMGMPMSVKDWTALTMFGDVAAALTPWRAGGEPARLFGAAHAGAPAPKAIVALGLESIVTYVVVIGVGAVLALEFGSEWAGAVHHGVSFLSRRVVVYGSLAFGLIALIVFHRLPRHIVRRFIAALVEALRQAHAAPRSELVSLVLLTLVSLAARVMILPVVAASFGEHPPLGVITLASFGLLNGQVLAPTPSGAGAVELAAAAGALGIEEHTGAILATWRVYTTLLPIILGIAAGAIRYGRSAALSILRIKR